MDGRTRMTTLLNLKDQINKNKSLRKKMIIDRLKKCNLYLYYLSNEIKVTIKLFERDKTTSDTYLSKSYNCTS